MVEVAALLLALLAQQRGQIEIPCQNLVLALLGHLARRHQLRIYRLGAKLQCPQQILQLPQVEYVLRNVLLAFRLCYIHIIMFLLSFSSLRLSPSLSVSLLLFSSLPARATSPSPRLRHATWGGCGHVDEEALARHTLQIRDAHHLGLRHLASAHAAVPNHKGRALQLVGRTVAHIAAVRPERVRSSTL